MKEINPYESPREAGEPLPGLHPPLLVELMDVCLAMVVAIAGIALWPAFTVLVTVFAILNYPQPVGSPSLNELIGCYVGCAIWFFVVVCAWGIIVGML